MKSIRFAACAAAFITPAFAAQAADMPVKAPRPAAFDWSGCYGGIHGGGEVAFNHWEYSNAAGAVAGVQAGCNYQAGAIVLGAEADASWSTATGRTEFAQSTFASASTGRNRSNADIALRAGVALDRTLLFGKAGIASGRFAFDFQSTFGQIQTGRGRLDGLLLGAGVEYAFASQWSAKVEYDYIGYFGRDFPFTDNFNPPFILTMSAFRHVVTVGINYRFGSPFATSQLTDAALGARAPVYKAPTAAPFNWSGCYVGVHGGGGVLFDQMAFFFNGGGGIAGAQAGCNYQTGALVLGVEGEGWWSKLASHGRQVFLDPVFPFAQQFDADNHGRNGDIALRAGLAVNDALLYGKVGAARGAFSMDYNDTGGGFYRTTARLNALLMGAGIEYAFSGNWSAKVEYDYLGFLGRDARVVTNTTLRQRTLSAEEHLVKVGINYRLIGAQTAAAASSSLPLPAHDWTGCYVGAQGGGGVLYHDFTASIGGGGLVGGQAGCNNQAGRLVFGLEGEGWSSGLQSIRTSVTSITNAASVHNDWNLDLAARGGVAVERGLLYGKVGIARAPFDMRRDRSTGTFEQGSQTLTGVLLGTGLEYAFAANWSGKLEYNYIGYLGRGAQLVTRTNPIRESLSATSNVVKAGLNYNLGAFAR
jgi:outer membrane immunogenic protein